MTESTHKQVIVVRKDLNMRKGKIAAQAAHASLKAILDLCHKDGDNLTLHMDDRLKPWITGLFKKICVSVNSEAELINIYQQALDAVTQYKKLFISVPCQPQILVSIQFVWVILFFLPILHLQQPLTVL